MKKKDNRPLIVVFLFLFIQTLLGIVSTAQNLKAFESYFLRSRNYPSFENLWTLDGLADGEAQGVTHDDNNWFFTWTYNDVGYLIKVPVDVPIDNAMLSNPKVSLIRGKGYWHWGDPDHFKYGPTEYIVVPSTGGGQTPLLSIYRAKDLSYVAYGYLSQQPSTGWCAVHPITGELYTSDDFDYNSGKEPCNISRECDDQDHHCLYDRKLLRYSIPWDKLPLTGYLGEITLTPILSDPIKLTTSDGKPIELYNMQGGEFSPSGELLYISSGSACCLVDKGPGQQYDVDGVTVFNTQTWRSKTRSFNHDERFRLKNPPKYFDYYYPLGCDGAGSWSPEGLTVWSLQGRAPGITGQLHVLLFKFRKFGENRQVFEHFTTGIYVDPVNGVDTKLTDDVYNDNGLPGSPVAPLKTFKFAYTQYPAWDGSIIVLRGGGYSGVGKYSTRIQIKSEGGRAIIR